MDWKKIQKDCPKAFQKHIAWKIGNFDRFMPFTLRSLYDFFDEHKIYIIITYLGEGHPFDSGFTFEIRAPHKDEIPNILAEDFRKDGITRTDAEEAAFEKAFEILNKGLSKS